MKAFLLATALIGAFAGCAARSTPPPASASPAARAAVADLAKASGTPEAEITIVSEAEATWPDACLGCAREGEMCAQVVTPGSRVVLLARGATYEYHADRAGRVRLCP